MLLFLFGAISLSINITGIVVLSDISQMLFSFPRPVFYFVINNRFKLMIFSSFCFVLGFAAGTYLPATTLIIYTLLYLITFFSGYWAAPLLIFPDQQDTAQYVEIEEAQKHLKDDDEVMVLVIQSDARAFPTDWIVRPHVAGANVGGEEVIMTYCGLSHLSVPYKNTGLDLSVMAQTECNLILVDNTNNEPIQQIYGEMVNSKSPLQALSSTFMSFDTFKKLYPDGTVYFNPPSSPFDKVIRTALGHMVYGIQYNPEKESLAFPNVKYQDNRVPLKEQVYGVEIDGQTTAYRLDNLKVEGHVIDIIGGQTITVKYFPEYDYVDIFYGTVPDVMPTDTVERVPHANRILWGIWSNFYRDTTVYAEGSTS